MRNKGRRSFLRKVGLAGLLYPWSENLAGAFSHIANSHEGSPPSPVAEKVPTRVAFDYAPSFWQSTYCFPDDPHKSLVGKNGELLYGHPGLGADLDDFAHRVSVGLATLPKGEFKSQQLEKPEIPIVTTNVSFPDAALRLVSFATNRKDEGRVDNLIIEFVPSGAMPVNVPPVIVFQSKGEFKYDHKDESRLARKTIGQVYLQGKESTLFMAVDSPAELKKSDEGYRCALQSEQAAAAQPARFFVRFPQEGQSLDKIRDGLSQPDLLLSECRSYWSAWKPFDGKIAWKLGGQHQEFLTACARNILQSREIKPNGKKLFQVGPTVYRGLWFIDGAFLLEAARYLGYDKEADEALRAMWDLQNDQGAFFAGAGEHHWKDTAAALYSLARQADLSQNWDFFNEVWTDAHKAVMFLKSMRDKAINDGTSNGNYHLLPRGFGDSGIGGVRSEFTNTLWTILGLKTFVSVADRLRLPRRDEVKDLYRDLLVAFYSAYKAEMRTHPKGFRYLPMLMKEDPAWSDPDPLKRPQPQAAQLYLSHAIFPGLVVQRERDEEVIDGHIALMKAVTQEDIPAETGWLAHDAVWPYNAPMVAQVYMWARMPDLARKTFSGFLNHASPLYAWREEQSLLASHLNQYIGDMPHNWASAECVRFLRHMLVMELEKKMCLIEGIVEEDLAAGEALRVEYTPTKWGRVTLSFEPVDAKMWTMKFKREDFDARFVPELEWVEFSRRLPLKFQLDKVVGASTGVAEIGRVLVDGKATSWEATFRIIG